LRGLLECAVNDGILPTYDLPGRVAMEAVFPLQAKSFNPNDLQELCRAGARFPRGAESPR
jgi:hypothetical protein